MNSNANNKLKTKTRIKYIDTLKFVAIFAIVFLHAFKIDNSIFIMGHNFYKLRAFIDFGVPLFILVSGALLLNRNIDLEIFMKKKFTRICLPLLFYFVISFILGIYYNPLVCFWYSWMIIGAYLAIPLVNKIIQNSSMRELEYFVALIFITTIFYTASHFIGFEFALDLNFFINPISYIVLGYYLFTKDFKISSNKMVIICLILFLISTFIKMKVGLLHGIYPKFHLVSALDLGIFEMIQACSVFLLFKNIYDEHASKFRIIKSFLEINIINKFIVSVSRSTYGIFFIHVIIFNAVLYSFIGGLGLSPIKTLLAIIVSSIFGLISSWILTVILGNIPYIKYLSGYA